MGISEQANSLIHTSNLYSIERQEALAGRLTELSGMDNVFFSNSGAEANETAIKIARKYGHDRGITEPVIVVMTQAFHGRTMATLTATGNIKAQQGFGPLLNGFVRVPYGDADAIKAVVEANSNIVAVLFETVQGEGGLATATPEYVQGIRQLCDQHELLMMLDEVQTGNARTGSYFSYQQLDVLPDVVTTAKGLGNGVPIGACLARGTAASVLQPGNDKLIEIRGRGLMLGLVMNQDCPHLMAAALEQGLLLNVTAGNIIRLLPPLNLTHEQADQILDGVCSLIETLA